MVLAPVVKRALDHIGLAGGGVGRLARSVHPRIGRGADHPRYAQHLGDGLADDGVGPRQGRALGQVGGHDHIALVLGGDEAHGRGADAPDGQADQDDVEDQHQAGDADHPPGQAGVPVRQLVEAGVEAVAEDGQGPRPGRTGFLAVRLGLEQQGRHGRRQGQGHDQREDRRRGDGQGELAVELARDAADEGGGDEHRGQHQGDGDQRPADLVHGGVRRRPRRHAVLEVALDVLDHHDGVVDHDADGQHQAEQGQGVEGEASRQHHREGADQRDRDGQDRDDRRAPALQEDDDHDGHQHQGLEQGLVDLVDRLLDVLGGVVDDLVVQARREILPQGLHLGDDALRGLQGVGARLLQDADGGRRLGVRLAVLDRAQIGVGGVLLRAQLHPRHVGHPGQAALVVALEHDVGELLRIDQAALGLDLHLAGGRRLVEGRGAGVAGGDLDVVAAQGVDDVVHGQVARGGLVRVDPDPDGVVAGRAHGHVAHPLHAQQRLLDLQGDVVGHVLLAQRAVRRVHVHRHQDVRRTLAHGYAGLLHLGRQLGGGGVDPVLDQLLGLVEIGAQLEGDSDLQVAIAGGLRGHVEHVLDPVDLLLDRVGHGGGQGLGRGAGIGQGHVDRGRHDRRILRGPQVGEGDRPHQGDQDRDDQREHRPVDHEMRQLHRAGLTGRSRRRWRWPPAGPGPRPRARSPDWAA